MMTIIRPLKKSIEVIRCLMSGRLILVDGAASVSIKMVKQESYKTLLSI
jgi:hypothetical protein